MRVLRALVHENEAYDGVISRCGRNAGVDPDVIILGDIVVTERAVAAGSGAHNAFLAEERVQPAVVVRTPPVVLLDQKLGGEHAVDPLRNLLDRHLGAFTGRCVAKDHAIDGVAAEKPDRICANRADPPRLTVLIDLEGEFIEDVERMAELHMAIDVARERLALGIEDRVLAKAHDLGILRGHVHERIRRDAGFAIGEPFEQVGVSKRTHANRSSLVVDLAIERRDLELADVFRDRTHLAVADEDGGIAIDNRDLVVVDLLDILREIKRIGLQDVGVLLRISRDDGVREQRTERANRDERGGDHKQDRELLLLLRAFLILAASDLVVVAEVREHEDGCDADNDHYHPQIDRIDRDGRMEPPVERRNDEYGDDGENDPCALMLRAMYVVKEGQVEVHIATATAFAATTGASLACAA